MLHYCTKTLFGSDSMVSRSTSRSGRDLRVMGDGLCVVGRDGSRKGVNFYAPLVVASVRVALGQNRDSIILV